MQLTGYKMGNGYYIQITVICFNPTIYNPIAFRIDTGCDITVISLNDAINIKLDFSKLGQPFNSWELVDLFQHLIYLIVAWLLI